jgi:glycosyltransferase involved in cell wall biosynthesis
VLKYQCRQSNGGLYYFSYDEFTVALTRILSDPGMRQQLGRQGRAFVTTRYAWDVVLAKFAEIMKVATGAEQ